MPLWMTSRIPVGYIHAMHTHQNPLSAFSLVELSIVLVILGLLTGGILAGQSLIRAAELRSVSTEYSRYITATQTFRDKYFAIPGDMNNATSFWLKDNTNCASHTGTAGSPGTCNGNGDGVINDASGSGLTGERFQFWRQLALAGLIEGNYTGLAGSGGSGHHQRGTNAPASKLGTSALWSISNLGVYAGSGTFYAYNYGNFLRIGGDSSSGGPSTPILTPEEAWNIDSKIDDGKPARGMIIGQYWDDLCSAADDGSSAQNDLAASYRLSDASKQCTLMFVQLF